MSPASTAAVYSASEALAPIARRAPVPERIIVAGLSTSWSEDVSNRLDHLLKLPAGWDGYGAPPVRFENAYFALQLLSSICPANMSAPQLVPGTAGDLQIEWHIPAGTIELHVRGPNDVSAWRETAANPDGEEILLTNNFAAVSRWISEMLGINVAAVATAA
ncbi:hypothetical protein [Bradyrhizobium zhanjiangense]|uniref:Uncharacterized protein n=1 Tax=Bradyrhizobium zhanjiangense TaxID=1325107 RepID=A0A4Q0S820_9BRAD|nr:hypothetical protein [Bradyrhizobium zhanjiangense]RXH31987.1 hypothetical protein XH94_32495 [Bradyrhizobium zhanjiangense]